MVAPSSLLCLTPTTFFKRPTIPTSHQTIGMDTRMVASYAWQFESRKSQILKCMECEKLAWHTAGADSPIWMVTGHFIKVTNSGHKERQTYHGVDVHKRLLTPYLLMKISFSQCHWLPPHFPHHPPAPPPPSISPAITPMEIKKEEKEVECTKDK